MPSPPSRSAFETTGRRPLKLRAARSTRYQPNQTQSNMCLLIASSFPPSTRREMTVRQQEKSPSNREPASCLSGGTPAGQRQAGARPVSDKPFVCCKTICCGGGTDHRRRSGFTGRRPIGPRRTAERGMAAAGRRWSVRPGSGPPCWAAHPQAERVGTNGECPWRSIGGASTEKTHGGRRSRARDRGRPVIVPARPGKARARPRSAGLI